MSRCVYCLKTEKDTTFEDTEHVVSQFLGHFEQSPTMKGDLVCDHCNHKVFNPLEDNFLADSYEGLFSQMVDIKKSGEVKIKAKNLDIQTVQGFEDKFFDKNFFPFLNYESDKFVIDFRPQVKIKNYSGPNGYRVFTETCLRKKKSQGEGKLRRFKEKLKMLTDTDIAIIVGSKDGTSEGVDAFIKLLSDFGINYNENQRKYSDNKNIAGNIYEIDYKCRLDKDLMRFVAKLAFNYFIYCTAEEGNFYRELLYKDNFDKIRQFILYGNCDWKEIVKLSNKKALLDIEGDGNKRLAAHTILFTLDGNTIKAKISIFGKWIYEVAIGKFPLGIEVNQSFGCGHLFYPFTQEIFPIGPKPYSLNRMLDKGYGWFKT